MTNQKHPTLSVTLAAAFLLSAGVSYAAQPAQSAALTAKQENGKQCGFLTTPADKKEYSDTLDAFKRDTKLTEQGLNAMAAVEKQYKATCGQLAKYYPQFNNSGAQALAGAKKDYSKLGETLKNVNVNAKGLCDFEKGTVARSKDFLNGIVSQSNAQNNAAANAAAAARFSENDATTKQSMGNAILKAMKPGDGMEIEKQPVTVGQNKGQARMLLGDVTNLQMVIKSGTDFIRKQMNTSGAKRGAALTAEDQSVLHFKSNAELDIASRNVESCAALGKHLKQINDAGQMVAKDLAQARANHDLLVKEWANNAHISANQALKDGTRTGSLKSMANEVSEKVRGRAPASNITGEIPPSP